MSSTPSSTKKGWFRSRSGTATPTTGADPSLDLSKQLEAANLGKAGDGDEVGDDLAAAVGEELEGDTESESGKFKALLGILRKTLNVKDLTSVRISLPATMMEPIGNLEFWTYHDRPDYFAAIGEQDDELERFLSVLRWTFTKELKYTKHSISKPYNSILGEHFHCYYDVPVLSLHSKSKQPSPTIHLDESPTAEVLTNAGRGSSNNATTAAALKSSPSAASISLPPSARKAESVASSASSIASNRSARSAASASSAATSVGVTDSGTARIVIVNEQTSHHPPISHFWSEARVKGKDGKERTVRCSGVDQLSAKFTGANVKIVPGPSNRGLFIDLPDRNEEYQMTHPTAAVAGLIRAAPYATICDSTFVSVWPLDEEERKKELKDGKKKRLRAIIAYQEESWITRPRFIVDGVVYESFPNEAAGANEATAGEDKRFTRAKQVPKERIVGTLEGNWRGEIKFKKAGESSSITLVDLLPLSVVPKTVAPLEDQDALETRRVWQPVSEALYKKDYSTASREKQRIEQEQRDKAEERKKKGETYRPVFFEPEPDDLSEWDGRPRLTEAGKAVLERDFKADYGGGESAAKTE
ncbi:hypothetical protein JCM6882_004120 [Rhodosporidiobolus microsporus]